MKFTSCKIQLRHSRVLNNFFKDHKLRMKFVCELRSRNLHWRSFIRVLLVTAAVFSLVDIFIFFKLNIEAPSKPFIGTQPFDFSLGKYLTHSLITFEIAVKNS